MTARSTFTVACFLLFGASVVFAVKPVAAPPPNMLRIGMPVDLAKRVCKAVNLRGIGMMSFSRTDPDMDWSFYCLTPNKADLVLTYSRKTQKVTGISLYYYTTPRHKINEVFVPARSIRFEADGSHIVHFKAPAAKPKSPLGKAVPTPQWPPRVNRRRKVSP